MRCDHLTRAIVGAVLLVVAPSNAFGARIGPEPLLIQLEQGYGVVVAEVVDAKPVKFRGKYPALYDIEFKVHEVAAQPLQGEGFAFNPGDSVTIRLSAGYGCQIEGDVGSVLPNGTCCHLMLRRTGDGNFEHSKGASAVRSVAKWDASESEFYARLRDLAGEPKDRRLSAWVNVVTKATEPDRLRAAALSGVDKRLWSDPKSADADKAALTALRTLWNDPQASLSFALMSHLDYVLRGASREFEGSSDRCDVWLKNLLALTPEQWKLEAMKNDIDNLTHSILSDLAKRHPDATAERVAAHLNDKKWPAFYRRAMSNGLLTAYQYAVQVDPNWRQPIQTYFIDLMTNGEPFPIRVAAGDLEYFAGLKSPEKVGPRRWYSPDAKVRAAILVGVERLKAEAKRPGATKEFASAARELERVAKLLDARDPLVP